MTTARELAARGLPSGTEVDAKRRRLTAPERAGALLAPPDAAAALALELLAAAGTST